ncbi:hypothetical protein Q8F55_002756 [Vanrija albida]|uniref:BTB domain-containing protein n=1 Tax=Vanrija albida TaxID=181172 RepID=A0ABR3QAN4_9TREE
MPRDPARSRHTTPAPAAITNSDEFAVGDFALVSADNVRFRIDGFYLQSASAVFRDMMASASGVRELHFTDERFETALVIFRFLQLVTTSTFGVFEPGRELFADYEELFGVVRLCRFLAKYECGVATAVLALRVKEGLMGSTRSGAHAFIVGAAIGDDALCVAALGVGPGLSWTVDDLPLDMHAPTFEVGARCLNPLALPYEYACLIPRAYHWALGRAFLRSVGPSDMGDHFKKFLAVAKAHNGDVGGLR